MDCRKCGSKIDAGSEFCQACGAAVNPAKEVDTTLALSPVEVEEEYKELEIGLAEGPALVVKKGPFIGQKFNLAKKEITLGRDPNSDIFLDDVTVSRNHAKIVTSDDSVTVMDIGSLNGTYVNQELIEERQVLFSGDELQIGKYQLVFIDKQ